MVFINDILIYSKQWDEHLILEILRSHKLKVKKSKYVFAYQQIEYLGHLITLEGISADPSKLTSIQRWSLPTSIKELRVFLGLTEYYRKFIKNYSHMARLLPDLLK